MSLANKEETVGTILRQWPALLFWVIAALLLIADQASKEWALQELQFGPVRPVIPGVLDFTFVRNTGAAFGLLSGNNMALGALALVLISAGFWFGYQAGWQHLEVNIVGGLLLGGAIGNLIDRIRHGYVVDFIDVDLQFYDWPVFNIADSAISCCVVYLLARTLFSGRAEIQHQH